MSELTPCDQEKGGKINIASAPAFPIFLATFEANVGSSKFNPDITFLLFLYFFATLTTSICSSALSVKFSPACPFISNPLIPSVLIIFLTCSLSDFLSIDLSLFKGTTVAA